MLGDSVLAAGHWTFLPRWPKDAQGTGPPSWAPVSQKEVTRKAGPWEVRLNPLVLD